MRPCVRCEAPHPSLPVKCSKDDPCWGFHCDDESGEVWAGTPIPKGGTESDKLTLVKIVDRMKE